MAASDEKEPTGPDSPNPKRAGELTGALSGAPGLVPTSKGLGSDVRIPGAIDPVEASRDTAGIEKKADPRLVRGRGVVCILDALGIKGTRQGGAAKEMAHRIHHIGTISSRHFAVPTLLHFDPEGTTATDLDREHKGIVFEISAISDTIIITATSDLAPAELIKHLGHDLHRLYNSYVDHRLAFRGALSFGDFYREGNTIVGPAIDEAAEWHTLPDAACVIATPSAAALLDRLSRRRGGPAYVAFVQAPIPLKGGGTLSCWTLDWYRCWSGLSKLEGSFVRPPVPPEVARKLENTVALCRFLWDQFEKRHIRGIFPWRDASHRSVNKILRDIGKRGDRAEAAHSALIRAIKKDRDRELRAARAEPALLRLLNAFFEPLAHERPPRSTKPSARAYDNLVKRGFRYRLGSTATRRLRKFVEATKRVTPEMEEKAKELERVLAQN